MLLASMGRRSEYGLVKYIPARFLALRCLVGCQDRWAQTLGSNPKSKARACVSQHAEPASGLAHASCTSAASLAPCAGAGLPGWPGLLPGQCCQRKGRHRTASPAWGVRASAQEPSCILDPCSTVHHAPSAPLSAWRRTHISAARPAVQGRTPGSCPLACNSTPA